MHTLNKNTMLLAISLSTLAGCVDAIGFLQLGGYFISFMSGNSTQLAVGVVAGNMSAAVQLAGIIALFVVGTLLGTLIGHASQSASHAVLVLSFVTLLLTCAALCYALGWITAAIACMTLAMGAENATFQRNGDVQIGLTYMTGTLVRIGQRLANALQGGEKWAWFPYLLLWLGLIIGGVIGALLFHFLGLGSLWIAALWAGVLTLGASMAKL